MVRAPCCEKMGLRKGPWTPDEDKILVAHIQRCGHGNWRALPKQAGLLRCGKSCRLRWINYLRPDIKRGNFSKEEEETIIKLHELLGNRWSTIAARLPGRTDNEIKNVWHTHLKKRAAPPPKQPGQEAKTKTSCHAMAGQATTPVSPEESFSSVTDGSSVPGENAKNRGDEVKEESFSSEEFEGIDESFWSEALSMDHCAAPMDLQELHAPNAPDTAEQIGFFSSLSGDDMDFWLRLFMESGEMKDLQQV